MNIPQINIEMEQLITTQSILQNFSFFSKPNNIETFNQAKIWRKNVISNQNNIFLLINFFQEVQVPPECQVFIISMIRDIIDTHINSLQLSQIVTMLSQTRPDILNSQSVILMLGNLIGYTTRIIYQDEHFFPFNISEDQSSCTKLQWAIYHQIIECMSQPRPDCTEKQNNEIKTAFKREILISFFYLSVNAMDNIAQTEDAIHLLVQILQFDCQKVKLGIGQLDETTKHVFEYLQSESLFETFTTIVHNSHSPLSSYIVDLMLGVLNNMMLSSIRTYIQLIDMIIQFCSQILKMPNFFKDRNNINSFKNLFSSFPKAMEIMFRCETLCQDLLNFLNYNLQNDYILAVDILFSASQFVQNVLLYISPESSLFKDFTNFLNTFLESTLNALQNNPVDVYNSLLLDSLMRKETKNLIKVLFNLSSTKKNDCIVRICNVLVELTKKEFDPVVNFQIGFLLFVMRAVFTFPLVDCSILPGRLIFESAFTFFLFTNDKIGLYSQALLGKFPLAVEYYSLFFLKSFCKLFFASDELEKTIPQLSNLLDSPSSVVVFVFQRFWNDMVNNVCPEKASKCLHRFIEISRSKVKPSPILKIVCNTDYPTNFLQSYLVMPKKSILYYTVVNVMLVSTVRPQFLNSLEANFSNKFELETIKKLFKIFSSLFDASKDSEYWKETYLYFTSHFRSVCFHASTQSPHFIFLLKLLYRIILNMPFSNPFDSNEPYSFQMVQNVMSLLTNITNQAIQFLRPIQVDDTIYDKLFVADIFDSKPITLSEAYIIGLNERQMKMTKSHSPKSDSIHTDEAWSIVNVIIIIAKETIDSPIVNFGIMELYNDTCIFVFFDSLIAAVTKTSCISFVSQEVKYKEIIEELSGLIHSIVQNFRNIVISNKKFSGFILEFIRVTFLSHNREVVKRNCATLCNLIRGFSKPEDVVVLRTHFILAFNAALYFIDCFSAREFVFEFTRLDPNFFAHIGKLIEADLTQDVKKKVFHDNFELLWNNMANVNEESKEVLRQKLSVCFKFFLDSITPHSIKLYSLPSLAQYFNFS